MTDTAIIDSHAHLDYPQLADDLPAVLARAHAWCVACDLGVKLARQTPKKIARLLTMCGVLLAFTRMRPVMRQMPVTMTPFKQQLTTEMRCDWRGHS